jgi:hypothetical protein
MGGRRGVWKTSIKTMMVVRSKRHLARRSYQHRATKLHHIVNGQLFVTVKVRPIAPVDKATAESTKAERRLMMTSRERKGVRQISQDDRQAFIVPVGASLRGQVV